MEDLAELGPNVIDRLLEGLGLVCFFLNADVCL